MTKNLAFKDIKLGKAAGFTRRISKKDVAVFAALTGDYNPLHIDEEFARSTPFKGTIIHGMLAAALFATFISMYCIGRNSAIVSQEISYLRPIRPDSYVRIVGKVTGKINAVKVVIIENKILSKGGLVLVEGISKVKVMR